MWGISYFKLDSLKERKFAFQRIKFAFQRIKFAFQRIKFAFQRIKFAFQRIKFAFQRIKFAFQRIKFAFQRIKFASKESSCCKVVVSSVVHRNLTLPCLEPLLDVVKHSNPNTETLFATFLLKSFSKRRKVIGSWKS